MSGVTASDFTAIPVNSGFSDYYGRSVPMQDIQVNYHSPWAFLFRVSPVSAVNRKCGLSDMLSFLYHWFSNRSCKIMDNRLYYL